ncbi:DUF6397 family protein [Streptomyces sp. S.PNR 29]|uniref:DUF6397 family protein n=1 Tax=Streptomyces sp. S.PNR 29 TaxID=2973805 RepID=UPI0025B0A306|nr:DUF6397 family protein [Streptomyces sp. S.PNR 29]MDN0196601.1 DUF6397 family protein [Streptomyces sp. S.PNR 29]
MSGNTITHAATGTIEQITSTRDTSVTQSRAARELGLKRSEFDIGVHLGRIRTVPDDGGGGRRVTHAEIERLRAQEGFPQALRDSVKAVGAAEGAALMEVSRERFTRLARLGLLMPVKFYLNRYRTVIWLYLADELRQFAADRENAPLLKGRTPEALRTLLGRGVDLRPRNWRNRHLGFMLRQADDSWARAAVVASLLDPVQLSEVVRDPYERSYLNRIRPAPPAHGSPGSPAAQLAEELMTADDPDEIAWLRAGLAQELDDARAHRPAPRPAPKPATARPAPERKPTAETERSRGLLNWLRRRSS